MPHEVLMVESKARGFCLKALKLMNNYLSEQKPMTFSAYGSKYLGVPQVSVLRPILFNIFLSALSLILNDIDFTSVLTFIKHMTTLLLLSKLGENQP